MTKDNNTNFKFTSTDIILFAWEKRIPLAIISLIAIIISTFVSFKITELYKSTVVLYPVSAASTAKYLLTNQYSGRQTLFEFGEEEQCDQLLQILNSETIKYRIIEKYDLFNHYGINPDHKHKDFEMNKKYRSNIRFRRTKYISAVIEVYDQDPQKAADIANDIAALVDSTMDGIFKARTVAGFKAVEKEYLDEEKYISKMEDSVRVLQKLGVLDLEYQTKELTVAYYKAILEGNDKAAKIIDDKIKILEKYGASYLLLNEILETEYARMVTLKSKYIEARVDAEQILTYKYVVDEAKPADKKSYPKKSLIILQSTFSAFILAYIILLLMDIIRKGKKSKKQTE
jgi:LPS O-antigen subunit length determinant protein (WzzB/FepE family)